jgi:hypothetical protein
MFMTKLTKACVIAALTIGLGNGLAQAQDADIVGSLTEAETEKVGTFSRAVGQSYVCTDEADLAAMREDVRLIFNFITQDMGTDAAFLYAVGVGHGSRTDKALLECAKLLKDWQETREKFRLTEEAQ